MSAPLPSGPPYTRAQRWVALGYGVLCHALFAASVAVMFVSLYTGLTSGLLHLHGWKAVLVDALLLLQFAAVHSMLLTDRGRRLLNALLPLGLGRDLATTTFATIASLQLLATFALWSPSGVVWVAPEGPVKQGLTVAYVASWLLLAKSMHDAGLDVQIGSLGWTSVWRNQRPVYQPFARSGTFRHSRQPIYSSFTLILWTAPVWTPDHLALTVLWTGYCVLAPLAKEKRYRQFYGEAFARYQQTVPYWFPARHPRSMIPPPASPTPTTSCDVAIVGAGPVGLLLANLLALRGLRVMVLEKHTAPPDHSRAIGITPPSLEILTSLGLGGAFTSRGVKIRDVQVHGITGRLGVCSFRELPGEHPYILSLPQRETLALLEENLARFPNVTLCRGCEVRAVQQDQDAAILSIEGQPPVSARFVVACDGWRSPLRRQLKIRTVEKQYDCHFVMGDFHDQSGLQEEAHLFFTPEGAVESFPLPGGLRRWIVQTAAAMAETPPGFISELVAQRSGLFLDPACQINQSAFTPRRLDCALFHDHRVILCGDAAHAMSPIGGQGMNVGFADAEMLEGLLVAVLCHGQPPAPLLDAYQKARQKAARMAAHRAAQGMWLGTWTGLPASLLRDYLLSEILLAPTLGRFLGARFAMMDVPRQSLQ